MPCRRPVLADIPVSYPAQLQLRTRVDQLMIPPGFGVAGPPCPTQTGRLHTLLRSLSDAEHAVLLWLCAGKRNGEIATILGRSRRTVESHVAAVLAKLGAETRGGAVRVLIDWHIATSTPLPWPAELSAHRQP